MSPWYFFLWFVKWMAAIILGGVVTVCVLLVAVAIIAEFRDAL